MNRDFISFGAISKSSDVPFLAYDRDGIVFVFNPACERLSGYKAADIVGQSLAKTLIPKAGRGPFARSLQSLTDQPRQTEMIWKTNANTSLHIIWTESAVFDDENRLCGVTAIGVNVTEGRERARALADEMRLLEDFLNAAPGIVFIKDRHRRLTYLSEGFDRNFGYSRQNAIGWRDENYLPRAVARRIKAIEGRILEMGGAHVSTEFDEAVEDARRWMIHRFSFENAGRRMIGGFSLDITDLTQIDDRFRASAEASLDAVAITRPVRDERGKVCGFTWDYLNLNVERYLGLSLESAIGASLAKTFPVDDFQSILEPLVRVVETGHGIQIPISVHSAKGEPLTLLMSVTRAGDFVVLVMRDIGLQMADQDRVSRYVSDLVEMTESLKAKSNLLIESQLHLHKMAGTDDLTGLASRARFNEALDSFIESPENSKRQLSLAMLDFDHFKSFNDDYGHPAGDTALKALAEVLKHETRSCDVVCRYGGEEFAILMPDASIEQAEAVAERLRAAIEALELPERTVTASFGVSAVTRSITSAEALIATADKALYEAKRLGRNRVVRFGIVAT